MCYKCIKNAIQLNVTPMPVPDGGMSERVHIGCTRAHADWSNGDMDGTTRSGGIDPTRVDEALLATESQHMR